VILLQFNEYLVDINYIGIYSCNYPIIVILTEAIANEQRRESRKPKS